jgi:sulfate/thiosulfate transport system permease protein
VTKRVLPGFKIALTITLIHLGVLVLIPLGALVYKASSISFDELMRAVTGPRAMAAYRLTFGASFVAALINVVFGFVVAWVLARYQFFGKRFVDAIVDLPFALPTAVAGIALTAVYSENSRLGGLLESAGIKVAFAFPGIVLALVFVGLPFVVRTVEPVLHAIDPEVEEAAAVLGASRFRTFIEVIFPLALPALLTGFALSFARALGEYGSVIFISGNMPNKTEIVPLLIVTKLEQYDYLGATAIASVMLIASFLLLITIHMLRARALKREG